MAAVKAVKRGKVRFYRGKSGDARWQLKSPNGRILASGEGFTSMKACHNSYTAVIKYAGGALVEDNMTMRAYLRCRA